MNQEKTYNFLLKIEKERDRCYIIYIRGVFSTFKRITKLKKTLTLSPFFLRNPNIFIGQFSLGLINFAKHMNFNNEVNCYERHF
jgi:hypothetical protein